MVRCPEDIIQAGDGGFPRLDFSRGECTFCGECTLDCEVELFHQNSADEPLPWLHKAVVSDACLTHFGIMCRSCEDACEPRALRFPLVAGAVPAPIIDAQICNGCGACVRPCPEQAISMSVES
jgi:ferredoxin-type protein NapF